MFCESASARVPAAASLPLNFAQMESSKPLAMAQLTTSSTFHDEGGFSETVAFLSSGGVEGNDRAGPSRSARSAGAGESRSGAGASLELKPGEVGSHHAEL